MPTYDRSNPDPTDCARRALAGLDAVLDERTTSNKQLDQIILSPCTFNLVYFALQRVIECAE